MSSVVVDTHTVIWYIFNDPKLSKLASIALEAASLHGDPIYVPSICLVEMTYLVEKGRIPLVALERVSAAVIGMNNGFLLAPLDEGVAMSTRKIKRASVPDMPDRIIAATALSLGLPLTPEPAEGQRFRRGATGTDGARRRG